MSGPSGDPTSSTNERAGGAGSADPGAAAKPADATGEPGETKIKKEKDKDKGTKLIYSDNTVSPEEKMARLPRYAFAPINKAETVLGDAAISAVTGIADGHEIRS